MAGCERIQQVCEQGHGLKTLVTCFFFKFWNGIAQCSVNIITKNPENWRVKDDLRRLTYNLLRCPAQLLDIIGQMYENTKPEAAGQVGFQDYNNVNHVANFNSLSCWPTLTPAAMCIENLEGDYYIPGSRPDGCEGIWKEAQASKQSLVLVP